MASKRIARNVLFNWLALGVGMLVNFFVAPYVVHHLGSMLYGVWVLAISLSSYMNLLDVGLRGAVMRYVSVGYTQGHHQESNETVSGAMWLRVWLSGAVILTSIGFAAGFHRLFHVAPEAEASARLVILLTAAAIAINLSFGVFAGVLAALHRFDWLSGITMAQTTFRAVGMVVLLSRGHGIIALAIWEVCTALLTRSLQVITAFRIYPQLRLLLRTPSRETLRKLWSYSVYTFIINVAVQIAYYTDNVVVGAFLSTTAVTFYAIGGSLLAYARQAVNAMTQTFTPLASSYEAEGRMDSLRRLLIHGTRAALVVSLPIELALFFRGHTFIRLWMGEQFAHPSGTVLQILLISLIFTSANTTSYGIVTGIAKHQRVAYWGIVEAALNLALSIVLVRYIGIYGVAWGTTLPNLFVEVVLWPPYVCRLVQMPLRHYLWQTWLRTGLASLPFAAGCYLADRHWQARNLPEFFLQIAALLVLFAFGLLLIYRNEFGVEAKAQMRRFGFFSDARLDSTRS
ncbi:MAG TPA: flippase [Terriglobales bacterium]|nr:flippase [Terriglobales bacterium]